MSTNNTGGSAFPVQESSELNNGDRAQYAEPGMTLRDYFAAKALGGFASEIGDMHAAARWCYMMADAILKAREQ
jgi:hypothetical protein